MNENDLEKLQSIGDAFMENEAGEFGNFHIKYEGEILEMYYRVPADILDTEYSINQLIRLLSSHGWSYDVDYVCRQYYTLKKCSCKDNERFFQKDKYDDYVHVELKDF